MSIRAVRFSGNEHTSLWNDLVQDLKSATFLFHRDFMDYHADRFKDHSLILLDEKENPLGLFPAHEVEGNRIASHNGLTYGSIIRKPDIKLSVVLRMYASILRYYWEKDFEQIKYKAFPRVYNNMQTDEIEYCLFLSEAELYRRDPYIAVDRKNRLPYKGNYRREARKATEAGFTITEENSFRQFWENILVPNLRNRFGVDPVHSSEEITLLKNRFPKKIKLFTARDTNDTLVAGTVFFETKNVAHCQYISANDEGRYSGALNLLFITLLDEHFQDRRFFDFGTVVENNGRDINTGLLAWKERMGGRAYSHDFYLIDTAKYTKVESSIN